MDVGVICLSSSPKYSSVLTSQFHQQHQETRDLPLKVNYSGVNFPKQLEAIMWSIQYLAPRIPQVIWKYRMSEHNSHTSNMTLSLKAETLKCLNC